MYSEDDLLMVSALQHILFCERQCALIHIEQQWNENVFTVKGQNMHANVDNEKSKCVSDNLKIEYGMKIRSLELGITGIADIVEFHKKDNKWVPFPVEYKLGKPKLNRCDEVQLCAQAICLEEMLNIRIVQGAIFYGKTRRRKEIIFDDELRNLTKETSIKLHKLIDAGLTPLAHYDSKKCDSCSLKDLCMPKLSKTNVNNYITRIINEKTS